MASLPRSRRFRSFGLVLLALALGVAAPAYAQTDGVIAGRVTDAEGNPIVGATVTVVSLERGDTRTFETDDKGEYYGRGYRSDRYMVTMSADGFQSQQQQLKVNFGMNTVDGVLPRAVAPSNVAYDDINAFYQAGFAAYEKQDWTGARASMAPLIEAIAGLSGEEADAMRANALEVLGRAQYELGETDAAIATYGQLLEMNPDSVPAHFWKAQAHLREQDLEAALPHVRRAAELAPEDATMQYNAGVILLQTGAVEESIVAMERALELRPDFLQVKRGLADAYLRLGGQDPAYYEKALAQFREYLELAPDAPDKADVEGMIAALEAQLQR